MSNYEFHSGKLKIVPKLENETLEEQCKRLLNISKLPEYYLSWGEFLINDFGDEYIIINDIVYEIYDHIEYNNSKDFFNITSNDDGTFKFIGQFYNGGTCLYELLEEELIKLNKK